MKEMDPQKRQKDQKSTETSCISQKKFGVCGSTPSMGPGTPKISYIITHLEFDFCLITILKKVTNKSVSNLTVVNI
jgi:hypothetical protein